MKMNRKQFMKRSFQACLCTCGAALGLGWNSQDKSEKSLLQNPSPTNQGWIQDLEKRMVKGSETPAWRKLEKAELWIKQLMEHIDGMLDQETKIRLLQACGRSCFINTFGIADENEPTPKEQESYLQLLESKGFKIQRKSDVITFSFNWGRDHQNPTGLVMRDGYCMCPQVESGPPGLSPSYCLCSTGYVKESFERALGKPVKVELLDSLKMGGKDCIFKVEVKVKR